MKCFILLTFLLIAAAFALTPYSFAETRSAQDMAKECRAALDVFQKHVENSSENTLFAGECIGYVQGAGDVSLAMADNVKWFKVCIPDDTSTLAIDPKVHCIRGQVSEVHARLHCLPIDVG